MIVIKIHRELPVQEEEIVRELDLDLGPEVERELENIVHLITRRNGRNRNEPIKNPKMMIIINSLCVDLIPVA